MGKGAGATAAPPLPPRPEEDGESDLSKQEKLIKCDLLGIKLEDFDKGRLDMYHPPLPADASEGTIKNLVAEYRLFDEPTKGDPTLMPGQKPRTGGFNVNPPGAMPRPQGNMFAWMGFGGGGGGGGSGWFTPAQQGQPTYQVQPQPGTAPATGYGPPPPGAVRMMPPPGPRRRQGCVRATAAGRARSVPGAVSRAARCAAAGGIPGSAARARAGGDVPGSGADDDAGGAAEDAGDVRHGSADDPAAPSAVMESFACRRRRCRSQFNHYFRGIYYIKRRW